MGDMCTFGASTTPHMSVGVSFKRFSPQWLFQVKYLKVDLKAATFCLRYHHHYVPQKAPKLFQATMKLRWKMAKMDWRCSQKTSITCQSHT